MSLRSDIHKLTQHVVGVGGDICDSDLESNPVLSGLCAKFVNSLRSSKNFDQDLSALVSLFAGLSVKAPKELKKAEEKLKSETDEAEKSRLQSEVRDLKEIVKFMTAVDYEETADPRTGKISINLDSLLEDEDIFSNVSDSTLVLSFKADEVYADLNFNIKVSNEIYSFFENTAAEYLKALEIGDQETKEELKKLLLGLASLIQEEFK